jgi:DNA-binding NtrC family response regulator
MEFLPLKVPDPHEQMNWDAAALLIITADESLVETLGGKLREWGAVVYSQAPGDGAIGPEEGVDVILVDIRRHPGETLQRLKAVRAEIPLAETILINGSDNVSASMAGMRAGASDELTVPFDTATLKDVVSRAGARSQARRQKKRRSLLEVFGEAMSAATFAQAGEHETALDLLNGFGARDKYPSRAGRKNDKPK